MIWVAVMPLWSVEYCIMTRHFWQVQVVGGMLHCLHVSTLSKTMNIVCWKWHMVSLKQYHKVPCSCCKKGEGSVYAALVCCVSGASTLNVSLTAQSCIFCQEAGGEVRWPFTRYTYSLVSPWPVNLINNIYIGVLGLYCFQIDCRNFERSGYLCSLSTMNIHNVEY